MGSEMCIRDSYEFVDISSPWSFADSRIVSDANGSLTDKDFIGVKIGDVNGSAQANSALGTVRNKSGQVDFTLAQDISDRTIQTGITSDQHQVIYGLQLKFRLDNASNPVVISDAIELSEEHYHISGDVLYISWHSLEPVSIKAGERLFSISGSEVNAVPIDETYNQVYNENLQAQSVRYDKLISSDAQSELIVYPNQPNPFTNYTTIGFSLASLKLSMWRYLD